MIRPGELRGALADALPDPSELGPIASAPARDAALHRLEPLATPPVGATTPALAPIDGRALAAATATLARARALEVEVSPHRRAEIAAVVRMTEVAAELDALAGEARTRVRRAPVRA